MFFSLAKQKICHIMCVSGHMLKKIRVELVGDNFLKILFLSELMYDGIYNAFLHFNSDINGVLLLLFFDKIIFPWTSKTSLESKNRVF